MVSSANYVVVAADSTKVGREDFVRFAPISSVDTFITDAEISDDARRQLTDEGVEVISTGAPE
jgi:DeoR family transcriptional regulator, fructose operon transcriptional repressor